uniref:Nucleolysin TIA-1/TIAR n=1 Tax=Bursaphelenchus xylophilus TaxID=6326 RepID=A0A1I7RW23_BURXY
MAFNAAYTSYAGYGGFTNGGGEDSFGGAGAYNPRYHFQAAQNAGFNLSADDGQPRVLYVGNLDTSVTEEFVATLFSQMGRLVKTKVIFDTTSDPYAFVEFADHNSATQALQAMNKRMLLNKEMKVNWATQPGTQSKVDTSRHFHVFVGDLSPEVDNKQLKDAFAPFGDVSDAKVIRDPQTTKSKGYGFVSYPKREEAERAIDQMNGQWLGRRTIRTNWATRKPNDNEGGPRGPGGPPHGHHHRGTYEDIYNQAGPDNTSVYIGNIPPSSTDDDVRQIFKRFGAVLDIRHFKAQGYSFVKFDSKESAAKAIFEMNGAEFMGQNIRCSWGKADSQRAASHANNNAAAHLGGAAADPAAMAAYGSYGTPTAQQQQQYWQYYQHYYNNPAVQQQWQAYYAQAGRAVPGAPGAPPSAVPPAGAAPVSAPNPIKYE